MHLTGGILRHFRVFSTPKQNLTLGALSTPAHPQVTQTVRRQIKHVVYSGKTMNPNKFEQEVTQLIAKLPNWVSVAVGIASTVVLAFSLIQQNFIVVSLTFGTILWLACLYVWMKRTEPLVMGGRGIPAFPKWRRFAAFGMILIPLIAVGSGVYLLVDIQNDIKADTIVVADFDGPNPKEYAVTQFFLENLRSAVMQEKNIRIEVLQKPITAQDGPLNARELGKQNNADLLIWGWYAVTPQQVIVHTHFELLGVLTKKNFSIDEQSQAEVAQLENFKLQTSLSQELTSISLLALGTLKYQEGDYEKANYYFSLVENNNDLPQNGKAILGYFQVTSFIFQNDNESAIKKFEKVTSQAFSDGFYLPELFVNGAIAYNNSGNSEKAAYSFELAGIQYEDENEPLKSIVYYSQAIEKWREIGSRVDEGRLIARIGVAYGQAGDSEKSINYLAQALQISNEVGDRQSEAQTLYELGRNYTALGQNEKAIESLKASLVIARELGDNELEELIEPLVIELQSQ